MTIPVASVPLGDEEIEAAVAVLRSGELRAGARCAEFEQRFAERVGTRYAVAVSSGTAALHVAAMAVLQAGDEVLVPAFTFIATAACVALCNARPVLVDVDPDTLCIDVAAARRKITPRTRAMIPVHLFGHACDVDGLRELARRHDVRLIWDAAQAFGTEYHGCDIGCLDDLVCFSFYPTKNITTGEGGMITTNDRALAERCRLLRSHGQAQKYYHTLIGCNYRMTDVAAAIGLVQLERADALLAARRANAAVLDQGLSGLPGIRLPTVQAGTRHSYHQYTVQVDAGTLDMSRDELAARLAHAGVETAVHYPRPLQEQPAMAPFGPFSDLDVSGRAAETVLSLPVHPGLSAGDVEQVVAAVRTAVSTTTS